MFFLYFSFCCFLIFGNIKNNNFNSLESVKNSYTIKAISSNISLDRFYSKQDELKIINELIELKCSRKKRTYNFFMARRNYSRQLFKRYDMYKDLFSNNFGDDDLIIMGLNSIEKR